MFLTPHFRQSSVSYSKYSDTKYLLSGSSLSPDFPSISLVRPIKVQFPFLQGKWWKWQWCPLLTMLSTWILLYCKQCAFVLKHRSHFFIKHCSSLVKECSFSRRNTVLAKKHSLKCPEEYTFFNIEKSHCERETGVMSRWFFYFLDTVVICPKRILAKNVCPCSSVFLYVNVRWNSGLIEDKGSFVLSAREKTWDLKKLCP